MSKVEPKPFSLNGSNNPVELDWMDSGRDLFLDEFYFISYADQKKALKFHGVTYSKGILTPADALENHKEVHKQLGSKFPKYFEIINWVGMDSYKARCIAELAPEENPNYIKITGRMLMIWAEQGFVPQFDKYFEKTRKLIMIPIEAWEHFHEFSYMLKNKGWWKNK